MFFAIIIFVLSVFGLLVSSSLSLDSGEKLGKSFGLSDLIIGVLFIGFGTSLPELFVSHMASLNGKTMISLGNILGSNISNTTLILGISCLLVKLPTTEKSLLNQSLMLVIATLIIVFNYFFIGSFDYRVGIVLLVFFAFYLSKSLASNEDSAGEEIDNINRFKEFMILISGFVLMFVSGKYLISSISDIGRIFGFSEYVIAAIALALGTSAPELFTAIIAIKQKKDLNLILGNIIGSNIFNIALVLGTTSFYGMSLKGSSFSFDFICLLVLSVWLFTKCIMKKEMGRFSGVILLVFYALCIQYWLKGQY